MTSKALTSEELALVSELAGRILAIESLREMLVALNSEPDSVNVARIATEMMQLGQFGFPEDKPHVVLAAIQTVSAHLEWPAEHPTWPADGWDSVKPQERCQPPARLELIFHLIIPPDECDAPVGDLAERYAMLFKRLGKRNADIWYAKQVVTSAAPLIWVAVKRARKSAILSVFSMALRVFGMGLWADALKGVAEESRGRIPLRGKKG